MGCGIGIDHQYYGVAHLRKGPGEVALELPEAERARYHAVEIRVDGKSAHGVKKRTHGEDQGGEKNHAVPALYKGNPLHDHPICSL